MHVSSILLLNDREAAAARERLAAIELALSPEKTFALTSSGISAALIGKHAEMLGRRGAALREALAAYQALKSQDSTLLESWRNEPGVVLVLARLFRGWSQKQLADQLGMREQQVQRYESDRYRSISLSNLKRMCAFLGVHLSAEVLSRPDNENDLFSRIAKLDQHEATQVLAFVRGAGWVPELENKSSEKDSVSALLNYATAARDRFGEPAFLRSGLTANKIGQLPLLIWRSRVADLAAATSSAPPKFDSTDISWLKALVQLSAQEDGPRRAVQFLADHGILLFVVRSVPGMALDGAAFLEGGVPVIGLTLRYDRIDYFWFTLLHEIGHVFLHLDDGPSTGFFDDLDQPAVETTESEANEFAASVIVAPELWRLSPARLARSTAVVHSLAAQLGVNPALIFGKIRNERNDYTIFSNNVGQGLVRSLFF